VSWNEKIGFKSVHPRTIDNREYAAKGEVLGRSPQFSWKVPEAGQKGVLKASRSSVNILRVVGTVTQHSGSGSADARCVGSALPQAIIEETSRGLALLWPEGGAARDSSATTQEAS
jgi:hypothetical protein